MRTADRMLSVPPPDPLAVMACDLLPTSPILVADNVAQYVWSRNAPIVLEEFPSVAPPWPFFWIEYPNRGTQRRGVIAVRIDPRFATAGDAGAEKRAAHLAADGDDRVLGIYGWLSGEDELRREADYRPDSLKRLAGNALKDAGAEPTVCWLLALVGFLEIGKRVSQPVSWMVLALNDRGRVVGNRWQHDPAVNGPEAIASMLNPALQTIAFLHCKNSELEAHTPPAKLAKKHQKRQGRPLLRYQTIRLQVPRQSGPSRSDGPGIAPSAHIVAGHFAHYGDCCPGEHPPHGKLFGRLTGVYWMDQHTRGDPERGQVKTDFELVVREEATTTGG
jgi:hypothetical protein